ncbi:MAG: cupin domain-containing protein [Candidatus Aenigmatarchaeota archaeon]
MRKKAKENLGEIPINLKEIVGYRKGSIVSKTINAKKSGTLTAFAFDAGQKLSEHKASYDAIVYVMDGEGEFFIRKKKFVLKAGEMFIMPANVPHSVNASKKFKMLLMMIHS